MVVKSSNNTKYTCPECKAKIPKDGLEYIYKERLKNFILNLKRMEKYLSSANEIVQDKEKQLKTLKDEQVKVNNKSQKFFDLYSNNDITRECFVRSNKSLEKRLNELEKSIPKLETEISLL